MDNQNNQSAPAEEISQSHGKTTVAPEVLLTIARLTALNVSGVSRMGNVPPNVNRLFQRGYGEGVSIEIKDDIVTIDLYVILKQDFQIQEVSRRVQFNVARAISEMVGMQAGRVNVHIEDIDYSAEKNPEASPEV